MKTLEEIKQEIEVEKGKHTTPYVKDKGYDMCRDFLNNNKFTRGENLTSLDVWECFKCTVYVRSEKKFSLEECEKIRRMFEMTLGPLEIKKCIEIVGLFLVLADVESIEEILSYITEENPKKAVEKLNALPALELSLNKVTKGSLLDSKYKIYLKELRDLHQKVGVVDKMINLLHENPLALGAAITFVVLIKEMEDGLKQAEKTFADLIGLMNSREKNRVYNQIYNKFFSLPEISGVAYAISGFITDEDKKETEREKDNQRAQRIYTRAIQSLEKAETEPEIKNPRELIRGIPDNQIKKDILEWIYYHNKAYYDSLEEQLEDLSSKQVNQYIAVLGRIGIAIHLKDIQSISHNSPEEVEEILSSLPIGNYDTKTVIYILKKTTIEIARKIKKYMGLGYISGQKVLEYLSLYDPEDKKREEMEASVEGISASGVNPRIFAEQPEYYWTNRQQFLHNFKVLVNYNLARMIKNITDFEFLLEPGLEEKIDTWIELGFYPYLEQNLALLNYPLLSVRRFQLVKQMNIPVEDIDTIENILESSQFVVSDEKLGDYILDYASTQKPFDIPFNKEDLENAESDKNSITLNGNIISLPKIKRKIKEGKSMWNAIFDGKILTEEEYNGIIQVLMGDMSTKK